MTDLYALIVGIAMGAVLQRVRASSPGLILRNLRLEDLSIIKFMATTIAVGMILVYLVDTIMPGAMHFDIKPTYVIGVLLGGADLRSRLRTRRLLSRHVRCRHQRGPQGRDRRDHRRRVWRTGFCAGLQRAARSVDQTAGPRSGQVQDYVHLPTALLALLIGSAMLALMKWLPTEPGKTSLPR